MSKHGRIFVCFPVTQGAEGLAHPNPWAESPWAGADFGLGAPGAQPAVRVHDHFQIYGML